ncbi:unnamed protein product [Choristocarpus tenellus]
MAAQQQQHLAGQPAVVFFTKSGLNFDTLKQVWDIADSAKNNYLRREEFWVAMRLLAMAQASPGQPLTAERVKTEGALPLPMPRMQGVPPPPVGLTVSQGVIAGNGMTGSSDAYGMSSQEKSKYEMLFPTFDTDGDGFVTGQEAAALFSKSRLPRQQLRHVWELTDADKDNKLSLEEFCVGMHLIVCVSKKGLPMPSTLPPSLARVSSKGSTSTAPVIAPTIVQPAMPLSPVVAAPPTPPASPPLGSAVPIKVSPSPPSDAFSVLSMDLPKTTQIPPTRSTLDPSTMIDTLSFTSGSSATVPPTTEQKDTTLKPLSPRANSSSGGVSQASMGLGDSESKDLMTASDALLGFARTATAAQGQGTAAQRSSLDILHLLVQKLQAEKVSLGAKIQAGQDEFFENEKQLREAEQEVESLQSDLSHLRHQHEEEQNRVAELHVKLATAAAEKRSLLAEIDAHKAALSTSQVGCFLCREVSTSLASPKESGSNPVVVPDKAGSTVNGSGGSTDLSVPPSSPPGPMKAAPKDIDPFAEAAADGEASPPTLPTEADTFPSPRVESSVTGTSFFDTTPDAVISEDGAVGMSMSQVEANGFDAFPPSQDAFESDPFGGLGGSGSVDPFSAGFDAFPTASNISFDGFDNSKN